MKEKAVKWKCNVCGALYESDEKEVVCPVCDAKEGQEIAKEIENFESVLAPKGRQKYIARYKKGRPLFKKKTKTFKK